MQFEPNYIYHIYNRGNNKQLIFFNDENYLFFLRKIRKELLPHFSFLAYCLMPNHFHFLVQVKDVSHSSDDFKSSDDFSKIISNKIAILLRSYTRAINNQENRTGSLFQQKTKAKCLNDYYSSMNEYVTVCFYYIHQNPLHAQLVKKIEDWKYSSFPDYAKLRNGTLCDHELALEIINFDEINFLEHSRSILNEKYLKGIWM